MGDDSSIECSLNFDDSYPTWNKQPPACVGEYISTATAMAVHHHVYIIMYNHSMLMNLKKSVNFTTNTDLTMLETFSNQHAHCPSNKLIVLR